MHRKREVLGVAATVATTAVALTVVLHLWDADFRVPFFSGADADVVLMVVKNTLREGWYTGTDLLGAPFGQQLYDYPIHSGDALNLVVVKGLGLITSDPVLVMNLFYVGTYFLVSTAGYAALRMLGVSPPFAVTGGVLYAFLPYHTLRHEHHLFLGAYWAVPLAVVLIVRQLGPEPMFSIRHLRRGADPRLRRQAWGAAAIAVALTTTGFYYAAFFVALLVVAAIVRAVVERGLEPVGSAAVLVAGMVVLFALVNLPTIRYVAAHGSNGEVADRPVVDSEVYGLKLASLVLPVQGHRLGALADVSEEVSGDPIPVPFTEQYPMALGALGALGFLSLLGRSFVRLAGKSPPTGSSGLRDRLAALVIASVLLGTVAGGSTLVAIAGFTQVRAWARLSIFIAFASLAALFLVGQRWLEARRRLPRWVPGVAIPAAVLLVGLFDQTTAAAVPRYDVEAARWNADASLVAAVEEELGPRAAVFQLPYAPFPEAPVIANMLDYDHLRGYLHSDTLRWSYGGMRGREADWQEWATAQPVDDLLATLRRRGIEGLWVNSSGYPDEGEVLSAQLRDLLGPPVVVDAGRHTLVFAL